MARNVGRAYVQIHADGSKINHEIVEQFDGIDANRIGRDFQGRFEDGWNNEMRAFGKRAFAEMQDSMEALEPALKRINEAAFNTDSIALGQKRAVKDLLGSGAMDDLINRVGSKAGMEMGEVFGAEMESAIVKRLEKAAASGQLKSLLTEIEGRTVDKEGNALRELVDGPLLDDLARIVKKVRDDNIKADEARVQSARRRAEAEAKAEKIVLNATLQSIKETSEVVDQYHKNREQMHESSIEKIAEHERRAQEKERRLQEEIAEEKRRAQERADADLLRQQEIYFRELRKTFDAEMLRLGDDAMFERFRSQAEAALNKTRISPILNKKVWERTKRQLAADYEKLDTLRLQVTADLPEREKERLRLEIEDIEARVKITTDRRNDGSGAESSMERQLMMANRIGGMFGRGSRMDGLHYFGSAVQGIMSSIISTVGGTMKVIKGAFKGVQSLMETFTEGMQNAAEGAGRFARLGSGAAAVGGRLASMAGALAASGPAIAVALAAAAAAIVAVIGLASVLMSVLSALTGIVTGLVATITAGLTGGLLVLGGALTAVAAAGGALVLAFKSLNDEQKKMLSESMDPFISKMKEVGGVMATEMSNSFDRWGNNLERFASMVEPLGERMGRAFGRAGEILTASLTGPGFQKLTEAFGVYLPGIITNFSRALGGVMNGLAGMFAAVMPHVSKFAAYLRDAGQRFSEWANNAKGQNAIVDFADRAIESFKSLWGAMREVGGFLKDVLFNPATMEFGNRMFDGLRDTFAQFRKDIQDGNLEKWLDNAEKFGVALWDLMSALGGTMAALSDSGTISMVSYAFEGLAAVIRDLNPLLGFLAPLGVAVVAGALTPMLVVATALAAPFIAGGYAIKWVVENIDRISGAVNDAIPGLGMMATVVGGIGDIAGKMFGWGDDADKATSAVKSTAKETQGYGEQVSRVTSISDMLTGSTGKLSDGLFGLDGPFGVAVAGAKELEGAEKSLAEQHQRNVDAVTNEITARLDWKDAVQRASDSIAMNGRTLDENTQAGRNNMRAILNLRDSWLRHNDVTKATPGALNRVQDSLIGAAKQAGKSEGAARRFANELLGIPKWVETKADFKEWKARQAAKQLKRDIEDVPDKTETDAKFNDSSARSAVALFEQYINQATRDRNVNVTTTWTATRGPHGQQLASADGNIFDFYANGGMREKHVAQIAPAGAWRVWAEPETMGEAYIPFAPSKRTRSIEIWKETGRRLGTYFADGGFSDTKTAAKGKGKEEKVKVKGEISWLNPFIAWANSLIKSGPGIVAQVRAAVNAIAKDITTTISSVSEMLGGAQAGDALKNLVTSMQEAAASAVDLAQTQLNAAAEELKGATTKKAAAAAKAKVDAAMEALDKAKSAQAELLKQGRELTAQGKMTEANVKALLEGKAVEGATLADYAEAREQGAQRLADATVALEEAIALRDDFQASVVASTKGFASLLTAQAQTIDGVQQALTAGDITKNLQDRLKKIRDFQQNLRSLLSMGLGADAYQQLVNAGVEQGGEYAQAILEGGGAAVDEINNLTDQINTIADELGTEASSHLYQAGVDMAQGLVDGLVELNEELDAAASALGTAIAEKILARLAQTTGQAATASAPSAAAGVGRSPSAVAATSAMVAASPELMLARASFAAQQPAAVSGNTPAFRDLVVHTPTADPKAVAYEVLNEVTGRI